MSRVQILLRGVGGQVLPYVVRKLATQLIARGRRVRMEETFGMAQRGGSVGALLDVELDAEGAPPLRRVLLGLERIEGARGLAMLGPGDRAFISSGVWLPPGPAAPSVEVPTPAALSALAERLGISLVEVEATPTAPWPVVQAAIACGAIPES